MLSGFFRKKISIFRVRLVSRTRKTPHRENVPFSLCAISCGAPAQKIAWLKNVPFLWQGVICVAPLRGASQKIEIFMKSPPQNILFKPHF